MIVDYRGLIKKLDEAMELYSGAGLENFDGHDLKGVAVSYTHLDVYKRQSPITAATGNAVENAADSPCHARLFGSRADVYKRQVHQVAGRTPGIHPHRVPRPAAFQCHLPADDLRRR